MNRHALAFAALLPCGACILPMPRLHEERSRDLLQGQKDYRALVDSVPIGTARADLLLRLGEPDRVLGEVPGRPRVMAWLFHAVSGETVLVGPGSFGHVPLDSWGATRVFAVTFDATGRVASRRVIELDLEDSVATIDARLRESTGS
jgi:hypothetical protein